MATLKQKIEAEMRVRDMLADNGVPAPDEIEYGQTCIRCFWDEPKLVLVVDIDEPPEGFDLADDDDELADFGGEAA